MYRKRSVLLKMKPVGTPAVTGYFFDDLPFRNIRSHLLN